MSPFLKQPDHKKMPSVWIYVLPWVLLCLFSLIAATIDITEKNATRQEGSCVTINCSFTFKDEMHLLWIKDPMWNKTHSRFDGAIVYSNTEERPQAYEYSDRVEFVHQKINEGHTCNLIINHLKKTDSGNYSFRYIKGIDKYKSEEFNLTVTDNPCMVHIKQLNMPFQEGDKVSLCCATSAACMSYPTWLLPDSNNVFMVEDDGNKEKHSKLNLTLSWEDDGKTFTCQPSGRHDDKCLHRSVTLRVEYAPKETELIGIPSTMDVKEGEQLKVVCSSKAHPKANYTWFKNEIFLFQSGETLTLNHTTPEDRGMFYCQAENKHGSQKSQGIKINVIYAPKGVSIGPQPTEIKEGDKLKLTCFVEKSNPAVDEWSYTWYRDQVIIEQKKRTFTVSSVTRHDKGWYRCQARNSVGETMSDNSIQVLVQYVPQNTEIQGISEIKLGFKLDLKCVTDSHPPPHNYSWYFKLEHEPKFFKLSHTRHEYRVEKVSVSDAGLYKCSAENALGQGANTSEFNVHVVYPPKKLKLIMKEIVKENETYSITCTVESSPQARLILSRSSPTNPEKVALKMVSWNHLSYTANASVSDAGVYTCAANNTEGENSTINQLKVLYAPKNVSASAHPSNELNEGSDLELTCNSESEPKMSRYKWMKFMGKTEIPVRQEQKTTLHSLKSSDSGHYFCVSTNDIGSAKSPSIYIRVKYLPRIKIIHNMTSLGLLGNVVPVHLSCSAQSDPPAIFAWYKLEENTTVLSNNQNYTVQPRHPGTYYCDAKNELGTSRSDVVKVYLNRFIIKRLVQVIISLLAILFLIGVLFLVNRFILRKRSVGKNEASRQSCFFPAATFCSLSNLRPSRSHNNTMENLVVEGSMEPSGLGDNQSASAVHSNPLANRNKQAGRPNSNIHTVYDAVKLPPSKPKQHHSAEDLTTVNYAMLQFMDSKNPNKSVPNHDEGGPVYSEVSKKNKMAKERQGGHEDYENVFDVCVPKPHPNINWDSDSSESEEEEVLNYTKVSFTATSHHNPPKDVFASNEEDKTEYSEVKI